MTRSPRKLVALGAATLALVVGVGAAVAATNGNGNSDLKRAAQAIAGKSTFEATVAKKLGTTVAKLRAAYVAAANSRIDAALKTGDITAAEAETLKDAVADGHMVHRLALPADVAKELGTTTAKLTEAYSEARKDELKARVDQAVADGKITKEYAEQLKARIDEADFPAFGGHGFGGPGGHGHHGRGGGMGFGFDFGLPPSGSSSSSSSQPAALFF
jgi:hypothetical protein